MKIKKLLTGALLALSILFTSVLPLPGSVAEAAPRASSDMRGIWVSYNDYAKLGLANVNESTYRAHVADFLDTASSHGFNTVILHVRAFDDAIWKSRTFPASSYMTQNASRGVSAAKTYTYDPLKVFLDVANGYDMEVHAWLNPYRITLTKFLDPAKSTNQSRVRKAIKELSKYDIAGIHFDDYFYHSQGGYVKNYKSEKVYNKAISPAKKRTNVNKLIKSCYRLCHSRGLVFGISPQGNYDNDMNSGADVKTWLSKNKYVDYVAPQIYWTNQYGASGNVKMFSDRLNQFDRLHTNDAKLYAGLALYRTGMNYTDDPGWARSNTNMQEQIMEASQTGWDGYIMFSAAYLYNSESAQERYNFTNAGASANNTSVTKTAETIGEESEEEEEESTGTIDLML
ncbi:MAG: family 10 glycosylhydrolase [Lachnospiraceae bacterium]|nr:family 10 glycosylhydrolase [Lachnospiraceae bacterium]